MKYIVEITKRDLYEVEADSYEEARELAINGCCDVIVEDEVENFEIRKAE